jgi:hypothetical protein
MLATTLEIIRSGLKSDPSLNPGDRSRLLTLIRNGCSQAVEPTKASEPRLIRRAGAAHILGCSLRLVDRLAKDGSLVKRKLPGRKRAAGFLEADVLALIK